MKTLMVIDPRMCSECKECISACEKEHGKARVKKSSSIPIFCLHCHPDKAPCAKICPTGAIKEENGALKVDEDACILCKLCLIACPVGMIAIDEDKKSAQKCTLCMETDGILPACVEACKDNVLKVFSVKELEELTRDTSYAEILQETLKACKF